MRMSHTLPLLLVFASVGCVEKDPSVFIQGIVPIDPGQDCVVEADSDVFVSNGVLDIGPNAPRSYVAAVQVVTNLPSTFSTQDVSEAKTRSPNYPNYGSADNNVIIFDSADIDYEFLDRDDNATTLKGQRSALGGSVFNVQTSLSNSAILAVEALSAVDAEEFYQEFGDLLSVPGTTRRVMANIHVHGQTTGFSDVDAFPFPFPIDLCVDCLFVSAANCVDDNGNAGTVTQYGRDKVCRVGQDLPNGTCTFP